MSNKFKPLHGAVAVAFGVFLSIFTAAQENMPQQLAAASKRPSESKQKRSEKNSATDPSVVVAPELIKKITERERLVAADPSNPVYINNLGVSYFQAGRFRDSASALEKAAKMEPLHGTTLLNLSLTYRSLNRMDAAIAAAGRALKMLPERIDAHEFLCNLYLNSDRAAEALPCYKVVREKAPNSPAVEVNYGAALFIAGEKEKALEVLKKTAAAFPNNGEAHFMLGVVQFRMKKNNAAVDSLKRAVESRPDHPIYRYNLAIAQIAVDNGAGALSQYKLLKTSDPEIAAQLYKLMFAGKIYTVEQK